MSKELHPAQTRTGHQVSTPYLFTALAPASFPSCPGTSISIDPRSEGSLTVDNYARRRTSKNMRSRRYRRELATINLLPDDVLLEMFDFYVIEDYRLYGRQRKEKWITPAHVCRRWRSVFFQSPCRLNLRLVRTAKTPTRDTLDIWLPLPLIIRHDVYDNMSDSRPSRVDNIIVALEHNDRVCQIKLGGLSSRELEYVKHSAAMLKPFPQLKDLRLGKVGIVRDDGPAPILPGSFLGGTALRLRSLALSDTPFPGLPKLLLSAAHLVYLDLSLIPRSGYIPPEAMAVSLSALTNLESLRLHFRYPPPRPSLGSLRPPPPPLTRTILPSLTKIQFKGVSEYLEMILARIDAPLLNKMCITFFNQIIFDTPQLFQFISRRPMLRAPEKGHITFNSKAISVGFSSQTSDYGVLSMRIPCTASEWQLSSLEQICTSSLPPVSTLEDLDIFEDRKYISRWQDNVESTLWLDLLHPFVAVKNLYLCRRSIPHIALALQELVGARTTEVLPALKNIFLEGHQPWGPVQEGIEKFVAARQLTSHPVAVSHWNMDPWYFSELATVF